MVTHKKGTCPQQINRVPGKGAGFPRGDILNIRIGWVLLASNLQGGLTNSTEK